VPLPFAYEARMSHAQALSFRQAVERKSVPELTEVLAEDVVFHSPAVHAPYEGRKVVLELLEVVLSVFEDFRYPWTIREGDREVLNFTARVGERDEEVGDRPGGQTRGTPGDRPGGLTRGRKGSSS